MSYVLADGTEMFPADWVEALDEAGGLERMRDHSGSSAPASTGTGAFRCRPRVTVW